jgi:protocatechuate 3,4-dioxygenase beta subunit
MCSFTSLKAQESPVILEEVPLNYKKRSPLYDYSEKQLNNTDTIPDFERRSNKLKITGTIFQSDGVTPAKDIILYIYQPDEDGNYDTKRNKDKRYVNHRGWIKTDADGHYTFYAFVPGSAFEPLTFPRKRGPKQIHPVIKEPGLPEYNLDAFLFDDDPYLTERCRKKLERIGYEGIVKLDKEEGLFVASRDIVLKQSITSYK